MSRSSPFRTFFQAGFECSSHRRRDGVRLDLIAATKHDVFARQDYQALQRLNIATVRDGLRWHLIEPRPGEYEFSSVIGMIRAAQISGTQVVWDVCHYGWPDDLDVFSPAFPARLAAMARAFALLLKNETDGRALLTPMNEPSFLSWAGGEVGYINPCVKDRGLDLKIQLARAVIESCEAIRGVLPEARFVHCEPAIHIAADPAKPQDEPIAEHFRLLQFQWLDLLAGLSYPELGGSLEYIDVVGLNYYWNNQWIHNGRTLLRMDPLYRPFRDLLREFHQRYDKPVFVSETGIEGKARPHWLRYMARETAAAIQAGVPVDGICLYPILNHPGWDNDRYCPCGLFDYPRADGAREPYQPLLDEIEHWQGLFEEPGRYELSLTRREA